MLVYFCDSVLLFRLDGVFNFTFYGISDIHIVVVLCIIGWVGGMLKFLEIHVLGGIRGQPRPPHHLVLGSDE